MPKKRDKRRKPKKRMTQNVYDNEKKMIQGHLYSSSGHVKTKTQAKALKEKQFGKRAHPGKRKKGEYQTHSVRIEPNEKYGGYNVYSRRLVSKSKINRMKQKRLKKNKAKNKR